MREILFKAKRIDNGEWVEGYLFRLSENNPPFIMLSDRYGESHEVDPSTICQCTGLNDKNGKPIWENDVLKCGDAIAKVSWCDIFASYRLDTNQWMYTLFFGDDCKSEDVEVIGNVFDNPELLNE